MSVTGEDTTNASTSTFLSAFIIGLVTIGGLLTVWVIIKNRDKRIFQPRTFLPPPGCVPSFQWLSSESGMEPRS